jgi:hypothetical protein
VWQLKIKTDMTEEQKREMVKRNREIAKRFCNLMEQQPLATANAIITHLANEYRLTPQRIGGILREQGIETVTPALPKNFKI